MEITLNCFLPDQLREMLLTVTDVIEKAVEGCFM